MSLWGNTAQQPQEPKKFANISNDQVNSNQQAIPVTYLAGRSYVAGNYISPAYNPVSVAIKQKTGKSESSITGYKYFADFAMVFCMGGRNPVDGVFKIIIDNDIHWKGTVLRSSNPTHNKEVIKMDGKEGTLHLYWGTEGQGIDNVLLTPRFQPIGPGDTQDATTWPPNTGVVAAGDPNPHSGHYDPHPAYRGQCYGVFIKWKLGRDRTSVPNIMLELQRGCPFVGGTFVPASNLGVNPIAVLYDWLTDTRFGMGVPDANIDAASFTNTYNQLESYGARISPVITQQQDFRQQIAELLEYFDGWIRTKGNLIQVGLWSHGAVAPAAVLTDNDLLGEPELEPQGWGPTVNEVTVVYKNRNHHYNDYVEVHRDSNNFRITGFPRPVTLSRPWITDASLAKRYARETGAMMGLPFTKGTLKVKREWLTNNNVLPGVVFEYDSGFYNLSFNLRLLEIEHGADAAPDASLTVEWDRSKWPALYIPPPFEGPGGFVIGPRAIYQSRITEVPYLIGDHRFLTQIVPLATRGDITSQSFRVWASFDAGATYQLVPNEASTSSFPAFGIVANDFIDTDTAIEFYLYGVGLDDVVSQTEAQQADDTLICFVEGEVLSLGTIDSLGSGLYSGAILRGRLGTLAFPHVAGTAMFFIDRASLTLIDNALFTPGRSILFKLQPFTDDVDFDLDSIVPISYTVTGFADIPGPVFSPSSCGFASTLVVNLSAAPAGFVARYTANGTAVSPTSSAWTGAVTLAATTTLRARFYAQNGRVSAETICSYTLSGTTPTCGTPTWSFSGTLTHSTGNITLTQTTAGTTIHYSKNGAAYATYSTPVFLDCNSIGDYIEFYGSASGYIDSPHVFVDNRGTIACGVPSYSFSGTKNLTSGNLTLTPTTSGSSIFYVKNYGATTAYSTPIALASTSSGDIVQFWATKSGLSDSAHITFDNTSAAQCSQPSITWTGTSGSTPIQVTLHSTQAGSSMFYSLNGGATTAYTASVRVNLNSDFEWWATAAGYTESTHGYIINEGGQ